MLMTGNFREFVIFGEADYSGPQWGLVGGKGLYETKGRHSRYPSTQITV